MKRELPVILKQDTYQVMNEYCMLKDMYVLQAIVTGLIPVREPVPNQDTVGSGIDNTHDRHYRDNTGQSIEIKQVEYNQRMFSEYCNLSGYCVLLCVFCCYRYLTSYSVGSCLY